MTSWTKSAVARGPRSALVPGWRRVHRLGVGHVGREDGVVRAVLDLLDNHRLVDVDAARVELDLAEEDRHVQRRERVANLLGIQRARILDCPLQGQARSGRLGDVVVGIAASTQLPLVTAAPARLRHYKPRPLLALRLPLT